MALSHNGVKNKDEKSTECSWSSACNCFGVSDSLSFHSNGPPWLSCHTYG